MRTLIQVSIRHLWLLILFSSSLLADGFQTYTRDALSLNGEWKIIVDPYENGFYNYRYEAFDQQQTPSVNAYFTDTAPRHAADLIEYNFDKSPSLQVPGDWNTQDEKFYFYEGSIWYRKKFDAPNQLKNNRQFLYFGAVNYQADVYLNGKKLGRHIGGFTPFYFEITGKLLPKNNSLVVKVDNKRFADAVPTLNTDWWNYGGITRDVKVISTPTSFIRDYRIALASHESKRVTGSILLDAAEKDARVTLSIPELGIRQELTVDTGGKANFEFQHNNLQLWQPESPKLYQIELSTNQDKLIDKVGFRSIETKGKSLLLNGKPLFLRGISVHEEYAAKRGGRVKNAKEAAKLLDWAKDLQCNFVRLAHYPHNEHMTRLADEKGILVWSEIPVYWTIDWTNEKTYQNAENQLSAMIERDKNRAAIIIWSMANETPVSEARNKFLHRLVNKARSLDPTRLISAALEKHYQADNAMIAMVEDPMAEWVDLVAFNEYIGWYDGLPEKALTVSWKIPYDKPVFISEFGGGAKKGFYGSPDTIFTEEFQEKLYINSLKMLDKIDGLAGMSPWILADFRSPRRQLAGIQDGFNRKGLYSEKGEKKKAFYILRDYYKAKSKK